ncbi:MAG: regulatory protein [Planctomycetota bacterium]|nr:MAG: regulatory protein [Planctomycetota bacterium]
MPGTETRDALLDAAQEFAQTLGYNAFSFLDLSKRVGVKTSSIHYWFPTKGDLGRELMSRYHERFMAALSKIDARRWNARRKLLAFAELFRAALMKGDRMCLCGMLATEFATLPPGVQAEVKAFFAGAERWLAGVLWAGRKSKELEFEGKPETAARVLFSSLEGAMMTARAFGDEERLVMAGKWFVDAVTR